jgi:pyruvate kinase
MSRTKIVATIGPATNTTEMLVALRDAGMDIVRLNGSHADLDWHAATIALVRETIPEIPILLDIPGRKIRTVMLAHEPKFEVGDTITLTTDLNHDGTHKVPVNFTGLPDAVTPGQIILADDGTLSFTVIEVDGGDVLCRAEARGTLRSRKGINVPGIAFHTPLVTDRDREMIEFARANEVDFVGISFVESAEHVEAIRAQIDATVPRIVSKIENRRGVENMAAVIAATDAVMIDRGDLSVETTYETVSLYQKQILEFAAAADKPVIVATEMLHSMIEHAHPTKAEISDITNAVLDRCAATMLSGETAIGAYAVGAVSVMRKIADAAIQFQEEREKASQPFRADGAPVPEVVGQAIALICRNLPITKIVVVTRSGYAARTVAAGRPYQPIIAVTDDPRVVRSFAIYPGTRGVLVDVPFSKTSTDHIVTCLEQLWHKAELVEDDMILVTAVGYPRSGNRMNLIQTHRVSDLIETLGWRR